MKTILGAAAAAILITGQAYAQQEPFGEGFDGWQFTQEGTSNGVNCRGFQGEYLMSKNTDGSIYVSLNSKGVPKGRYPESTVIVGGEAQIVDASSSGSRLLFYVDEYTLEKIAQNRGWEWNLLLAGKNKGGKVKLNNSATSALERVLECVSANGG